MPTADWNPAIKKRLVFEMARPGQKIRGWRPDRSGRSREARGTCAHAKLRICAKTHVFRPCRGSVDSNAKRFPRLTRWAKIFRPSGPELSTREICASHGKPQRQKPALREIRDACTTRCSLLQNKKSAELQNNSALPALSRGEVVCPLAGGDRHFGVQENAGNLGSPTVAQTRVFQLDCFDMGDDGSRVISEK